MISIHWLDRKWLPGFNEGLLLFLLTKPD